MMKDTIEITEDLYRISDYKISHVNNRALHNPEKYLSEWERRYTSILRHIAKVTVENHDIRIIMLAGPSSSGKTTTAHKIAEQVKHLGESAYVLSLDDFYIDKDRIPKLPNGNPDFENVTSIDLDCVSKCLSEIIKNGETKSPIYDMSKGKRSEKTRKIELSERGVVVVEGIHAMNPIITKMLPQDAIFKAYISVMSNFSDDDGKIIFTKKDIRLIRRMVRDYSFRNSPVEYTLKLWNDVLEGERKYIEPYMELADIYINSATPFDPCVLKECAEEILKDIKNNFDGFNKCVYIKNELSRFVAFPKDFVNPKSVLREFVGGSHFA